MLPVAGHRPQHTHGRCARETEKRQLQRHETECGERSAPDAGHLLSCDLRPAQNRPLVAPRVLPGLPRAAVAGKLPPTVQCLIHHLGRLRNPVQQAGPSVGHQHSLSRCEKLPLQIAPAKANGANIAYTDRTAMGRQHKDSDDGAASDAPASIKMAIGKTAKETCYSIWLAEWGATHHRCYFALVTN